MTCSTAKLEENSSNWVDDRYKVVILGIVLRFSRAEVCQTYTIVSVDRTLLKRQSSQTISLFKLYEDRWPIMKKEKEKRFSYFEELSSNKLVEYIALLLMIFSIILILSNLIYKKLIIFRAYSFKIWITQGNFLAHPSLTLSILKRSEWTNSWILFVLRWNFPFAKRVIYSLSKGYFRLV